MKKLSLLLLLIPFTFTALVHASNDSDEKPVEHLKLPDVTSMQEADTIFVGKTAEIKSKTVLDVAELQEIHIITYTLEKSVAYYVENLTGDRQALAKDMAVVVEDIHLASENNRQEDARKFLEKYFEMAEKFMLGIS